MAKRIGIQAVVDQAAGGASIEKTARCASAGEFREVRQITRCVCNRGGRSTEAIHATACATGLPLDFVVVELAIKIAGTGTGPLGQNQLGSCSVCPPAKRSALHQSN